MKKDIKTSVLHSRTREKQLRKAKRTLRQGRAEQGRHRVGQGRAGQDSTGQHWCGAHIEKQPVVLCGSVHHGNRKPNLQVVFAVFIQL
ncbi:hypothetical protein E2C01_063116 [Portunus trituberculatus]|uniref:Uncharacterized protein n=1 Tax=Portunus trituberculatus TaxID=210409 RepID=A0A5B7HH87_PORTR|nr:hypothetical protein [Portunus trituberculatus]